jgi:hypothetical protein
MRVGWDLMARVAVAGLLAGVLSIALAGCSRPELPNNDFVLTGERPAKAAEAGNTAEAAKLACEAEIKKKGISSVVNIFSRFRRGSAEEDYVACMKRRGYELPGATLPES